MNLNPITKTDYPDPDIIRVDDTYYMISTTMHFMPGGVILRSYDLVNWEIATYIFDKLDDTCSERLENGENNYGKGMWAASLRYHNGKFYVAFVSHGRDDTHLFTAEDINGPWEHSFINEYFHDCSVLFDDDRAFIVSGNTNIRLREMEPDLSKVKEGGIDKIIIRDDPEKVGLGYEGAHFYKINGKYYVTLIHWPKNGIRTEAVFVSDTVDGEYVGRDVMCDDMGLKGMGVAQGGLVDTPSGKWYSILFQDSGAVGRVPVLVPVKWENDFPVFGMDGLIPLNPTVESCRPDYVYESLFASDDFNYPDGLPRLKPQWQWNHVPNEHCWKIENGSLVIKTDRTSINPLHAKNILTQRMRLPSCCVSVRIDASGLNDGDIAGLIALQGCYCMIGIMREHNKYYIVKLVRNDVDEPYKIGSRDNKEADMVYKEEASGSNVRFVLRADFADMVDEVRTYASSDNEEREIGKAHKLRFCLDHFTGVRAGLCVMSQNGPGGSAKFTDFIYE